MNEDQLIQHYFSQPTRGSNIAVGIGDDAAVLDVPDGYQLVISTDTLLEGRHFPDNFPADQIASRAVAVCISDLAAMGAIPKWATLSISLPTNDETWLNSFSNSLHTHLTKYQTQLVGGDTVKGELSITLTVMGWVEKDSALTRTGAKAGDHIFVSGHLGDAALALELLQEKQSVPLEILKSFTVPEARVDLGRALRGVATSCMDISDGIFLDLSRLLAASGVGATVNCELLPLGDALRSRSLEKSFELATSGDDYELLFTVTENKLDDLSILTQSFAFPITEIGVITTTGTLETVLNGKPYVLDTMGYQHF